MLEDIQPSEKMKTDSEMIGKTHSGFETVWPNLQWHAVQKDWNQAPIAHLDQNPFAPLKLKSHISREIPVDDGTGCTGVHIGINPQPRSLSHKPIVAVGDNRPSIGL